jgi:hypothetical protein
MYKEGIRKEVRRMKRNMKSKSFKARARVKNKLQKKN